MDRSIPKPIRGYPTDRAIVGEECIRLFLGEDSLGVEAESSAPDNYSIRRRFDNRRTRAASTEEDYSRIRDHETR